MNTRTLELPKERSVAATSVRATLRVTWQLVRLPVLAFLTIIEPIVRVGLFLMAFLGVLTAFFYRFFTEVPNFPFWGVLAGSIGCMLLLMAYDRLLRFLSS